MRRRLSIIIHGFVQGVGFRYSTRRMASSLGLTGYVKNEKDGTVRLEAEGEDEALAKLLAWCRQGPTWSRIDNVEYKITDNPMNYQGFEIKK